MASNPKFELTQAEAQGRLWQRFHAWLNAERDEMRMRNDSPTMGIAETTVLRGELRLANRILALADEAGPESRTFEPGEEGSELSTFPPHGGFIQSE